MVGRPPRPVEPVHCRSCWHHGQKDHSPNAMRGGSTTGIASPVPERMLECMWFQTADGRSAASDERLKVIVAQVNGGANCPVRSAL